jgi:hypothetical protein
MERNRWKHVAVGRAAGVAGAPAGSAERIGAQEKATPVIELARGRTGSWVHPRGPGLPPQTARKAPAGLGVRRRLLSSQPRRPRRRQAKAELRRAGVRLFLLGMCALAPFARGAHAQIVVSFVDEDLAITHLDAGTTTRVPLGGQVQPGAGSRSKSNTCLRAPCLGNGGSAGRFGREAGSRAVHGTVLRFALGGDSGRSMACGGRGGSRRRAFVCV